MAIRLLKSPPMDPATKTRGAYAHVRTGALAGSVVDAAVRSEGLPPHKRCRARVAIVSCERPG